MNILLGIILAVAMWIDIKDKIIPNWLTFSLMLLGLIINLSIDGWSGLLFSLQGLGVGLAIFLIPFVLGGLGAGDVKLVAGIGAVKGVKFVLLDSLVIAIVGGIISLFILIQEKKLGRMIKKVIYRLPFKSLSDREDQEGNDAFPYGVAVAFGTWYTLFLH
ncbi:peptidase A24A prepilin type IV [Acetohalobium arabaticum DSM 5501]|uniref:Peptidase A24A prepilin type IV n=2 Tax=Acetohalobium TaxID=28186 RepID=D9QTL6_ACEAZ|nr:peptidase A24A prepilin type IV [Acetohalobium arabaticum DSM 5501]